MRREPIARGHSASRTTKVSASKRTQARIQIHHEVTGRSCCFEDRQLTDTSGELTPYCLGLLRYATGG